VPGIVSPGKITVKGAPAARRLLRNREPLSSDLARQVLGTYRKNGIKRGGIIVGLQANPSIPRLKFAG
jgi:hypothetical protein